MNDEIINNLLYELENGKSYPFINWSVIPKICAGVYTVWRGKELIYVGMSGRSLSAETISEHRNSNARAKGLITRLKSHASGRRSGDQFCVYVGDKLVLPTLSSNDVTEIANGKLSFDKLIKDYIHKYLSFRFIETENDRIAYQLEKAIRVGVLKGGKPLLNPIL